MSDCKSIELLSGRIQDSLGWDSEQSGRPGQSWGTAASRTILEGLVGSSPTEHLRSVIQNLLPSAGCDFDRKKCIKGQYSNSAFHYGGTR